MNKKVLISFTILFLTSTVFLITFSVPARASFDLTVHNIDSGLSYSMIQDAIDAPETLDRHTIFVEEGTYYENIFVHKNISLVGEKRETTIIDGKETGSVIVLAFNAEANITRFTIRNSGFMNSGVQVCYLNNNISDNILIDNYYGIRLYSRVRDSVVSGNTVSNNMYGIYLEYPTENNTIHSNIVSDNKYGIYLTWTNKNTLFNNSMTNNAYNFFVWGGFDNFVDRSNRVDGKQVYYVRNETGTLYDSSDNAGILYLINCNNVTVRDLTLTKNGIGVMLWNTNNTKIENVTALNNMFGFWLIYSNNNTISGNTVSNSTFGLYFHTSCYYNNVFGNTIVNNKKGITICPDSSNNFFHHNNFVDNAEQLSIYLPSFTLNVWDNGLEGNYWSDYAGVDLNHDGIGDSEYEINTYSIDNYPLMGIFHSFNTSLGYCVNVITNSTIEESEYFESNNTIRLYVSNLTASQTYGFCRVCIPSALTNVTEISVVIDDGFTEILYPNYDVYDNGTHRWIYFAYEHSKHKIDIIPELLSFLILPIFIIATLLTTITYKITISCNRRTRSSL